MTALFPNNLSYAGQKSAPVKILDGRIVGLSRHARLVLSTSVLSLLLASPAWSVNECGVPGAGPSAVSCNGAAYSVGIGYSSSSDLTVNFTNSATTVTGPNFIGVDVRDTASPGPAGAGTTGDITVNAIDFDTISGVGRGIVVRKKGLTGNASVTLDNGTIETLPFTNNAFGVLIYMDGSQAINSAGGLATGNASITMNGGAVITHGLNSAGLVVNHAGVSGDASIVINDGSIESRGGANPGAVSMITNRTSTGNASVVMNGGSILTAQGGCGPLFWRDTCA